jgi:carboxypeptidase Q
MSFSTRFRGRSFGLALALAGLVALPLAAQQNQVDLDALYKIKQQGFQGSQVMEILSYLTDVYGPRLTGSPNITKAAEWATKEMTEWGLTNVKLEPWGPFGRGWENERTVVLAVSPQAFPIIGYSKAWSPGTNGPVTAEVAYAPIANEADFAKYAGKLKGKIVFLSPAREIEAHFDPLGHRYTDEDLQAISMETDKNPRGGRRFGGFDRSFPGKRMEFLKNEGALAVIDGGRGDGGTVFVQGGTSSRDPKGPVYLPEVTISAEHYNRIVRMVEKDVPVTLQLDIKNTFFDDNLNAFNVVGEIPGTDKADELVMLGGHFDSWHAGTGATDNAAGSAVMMEAVRILKASGLRMRRTVRIGLWSGEEQGLLGSRAYVKEHFADPATMAVTPEHAKMSVYFNVDNGTGAIRGVYLQGNEMAAPIFAAWMRPFHNVGMTTLSIDDTGGTDHLAFDAVGLPGFQFIQDPIEYSTRTHHSNEDVYDRIQAPDMMQNAVIVATFVYEAANRDDMFPRKPLPKPQPPRTFGQ